MAGWRAGGVWPGAVALMRSFEGNIDLPILMHIEAEDEDAAEEVADQRFADAYALIEGTYLGARYDDTDITEVT